MTEDRIPPPKCPDWYRQKQKVVSISGSNVDPNASNGRLILNWNQQDKPFMEVEGAISAAEAIYMLEYAKAAIFEDDND